MQNGIEELINFLKSFNLMQIISSMNETQIIKVSIGVFSIVLCIGIANRHLLLDCMSKNKKKKTKKKDKKRNSKEKNDINVPFFPPGLINMGNTCFMNSILQALSSLPSFMIYLQYEQNIRYIIDKDEKNSTITSSLSEITAKLNSTKNVIRSFRPSNFFHSLSRGDSRRLTYYDQQDANELYSLLSSALTNEEEQILKLKKTTSLFDISFLKLAISKLNDKKSNGEVLYNGYPISNTQKYLKSRNSPFNGLLASKVTCGFCGYTTAIRHFVFDQITLIPPNNTQCSLESLLTAYISPEYITDKVCDHCSLIATIKNIDVEIQKQKEKINVRKELLEILKSKKAEKSKNKNEILPKDTVNNNDNKTKTVNPSEITTKNNQNKKHKETKSRHMKKLSNATPKTPSIEEIEEALRVEKEKLINLEINSKKFKNYIDSKPLDKIEYPEDIRPVKIVSKSTEKQVLLAKLPKIIAFHFQRSIHISYSYNMRNNSPIKYPEYLNLSRWCTSSQRSNDEYFSTNNRYDMNLDSSFDTKCFDNYYRLQSAVYHFGTHDSGHFIAYRRVRRGGCLSKVLQSKIKRLIKNKVMDYSEWENLFKKPELIYGDTDDENNKNSKKEAPKNNFKTESSTNDNQIEMVQINNKNNTPSLTKEDESNENKDVSSSSKPSNGNSKTEVDDYQWFRISDTYVDLVIDPSRELFNNGSSNVYMLFYETLSDYNLTKAEQKKIMAMEMKRFKSAVSTTTESPNLSSMTYSSMTSVNSFYNMNMPNEDHRSTTSSSNSSTLHRNSSSSVEAAKINVNNNTNVNQKASLNNNQNSSSIDNNNNTINASTTTTTTTNTTATTTTIMNNNNTKIEKANSHSALTSNPKDDGLKKAAHVNNSTKSPSTPINTQPLSYKNSINHNNITNILQNSMSEITSVYPRKNYSSIVDEDEVE